MLQGTGSTPTVSTGITHQEVIAISVPITTLVMFSPVGRGPPIELGAGRGAHAVTTPHGGFGAVTIKQTRRSRLPSRPFNPGAI